MGTEEIPYPRRPKPIEPKKPQEPKKPIPT